MFSAGLGALFPRALQLVYLEENLMENQRVEDQGKEKRKARGDSSL